MEIKSLWKILLMSLSLIMLVSAQGCLRVLKRGSDPFDPPFNDGNNSPLPANSAVQAIITTYQFYCDCVNITTWETYVQPGGSTYYMSRLYDITFQVWRPSPTVQDDGCYSLVGENVFTSFTFYEGGFVQLTPTPPSNSIITAQSGDVVGYYTNSRIRNDDGIQLERNRDYDQNTVWFLSVADGSLTSGGNNACPYPIGTNRYLSSSTGAAPMLKISSTTVTCPPSLPPSDVTSTIDIRPSTSVPVKMSTLTTMISPSMTEVSSSPLVIAILSTPPNNIASTKTPGASTLLMQTPATSPNAPENNNSNSTLNSTTTAIISILAAIMVIVASGVLLTSFIVIARKIRKVIVSNKVVVSQAQNPLQELPFDQSGLCYEVIDTDTPTTVENYATVSHFTSFAIVSNEAYAVHKEKDDDTPLAMKTNAAYGVHKESDYEN